MFGDRVSEARMRGFGRAEEEHIGRRTLTVEPPGRRQTGDSWMRSESSLLTTDSKPFHKILPELTLPLVLDPDTNHDQL